jgi:hypothetical protein
MEDHATEATEENLDRRATVGATEIRALEASLLLIGPMKRAKLSEAVHADTWPDGTFDEAVRQAVKQGRISELLLDWLRVARRQ